MIESATRYRISWQVARHGDKRAWMNTVHRPIRCMVSDRVRARGLSTGRHGWLGQGSRARPIVDERRRVWAERKCGGVLRSKYIQYILNRRAACCHVCVRERASLPSSSPITRLFRYISNDDVAHSPLRLDTRKSPRAKCAHRVPSGRERSLCFFSLSRYTRLTRV